MGLKQAIQEMIDWLRVSKPRGEGTVVREFLDETKDWSAYDIDNPRLPLVDKTIISKVVKSKPVKKVIVKDTKRKEVKVKVAKVKKVVVKKVKAKVKKK
jgi:hypothetical protein